MEDMIAPPSSGGGGRGNMGNKEGTEKMNNNTEERLDEALDLDDLESASGGTSGRDIPEVDGTEVEALPNACFRVDLGGQTVTAHLSGKMRMNYVRVAVGDRVRVQGNRITYRYR